MTKIRIWATAVLQVYVIIIIFLPSTDFYYVVMIQSGIMFYTLILSLQEYFFTAISRIRLMYKLHRYEYNRHACKLISLSLANGISLLYAVVGFYSVTLVSTCILGEDRYMGDSTETGHDFCFNIFIKTNKLTPEFTALAYLAFIMSELIPFLSYFWLNDPHDCFRCVGKDPDRRYSMFQLTQRETLMREHLVKFGSGAFSYAGNLSYSKESSFILDPSETGSKSRALSKDKQDLVLVRLHANQ